MRGAQWRHGVRRLGKAQCKESPKGVWIRDQEVTPGEAEGRERSGKIGRQRETGGPGGEEERHRAGRQEWVGVFGPRWGGEGGWKSWRNRVPQTGEGTAERGGPGTGKGSPRGLPGMEGAARLSAPRVLVLWAALGAAGKAWRRGGSPRGRRGAGCRGEGLRLLSPQLTSDPHLTPRTGGVTRRISRETSCQVQPGRGPGRPGPWVAPSWVPGSLSSLGVPAPPSLPQEFGPASEPQRLTMGHYPCAFQAASGGVSGRKAGVGAEGCVCAGAFAGREAGRSWLCWEPELRWLRPPPRPALSCNSSPRYIHYPAELQGSRKELQLPWALGQWAAGSPRACWEL